MRYVAFLRLAAAALILSPFAYGQRDLATILGTVTDPQGAVITGAQVTITEEATGQRYSATTDETGNFIRTQLKPGTYTVEVEATGFSKAIQRDILVSGGDRAGVNIQLAVGDVTQAVEVTAAAPLLQTESTVLGDTMQAKTVSELPLGGQRKFTFLARLAPGVVPAEQAARDAAGGGFSANGVRSNGQNNFLLNGVDNNVNVIDFINQTSYVIGPSVEAISEMRVMTNGYNAEYGRGAGGVVNVTIKSGTNQIHGTVYEFLQNDKLNANLWENNRAGKDRGPFKQNQYGVAIGGPLIKDRTFWFADWQSTRIRSTGGAVPGLGNTFVLTIPKAAFRSGDFSSLLTGRTVGTDALGRAIQEGAIYDPQSTREARPGVYVRDPFPGNIIPASRFDPSAKRIIDLYPDPNQNLGDRIPGSNFLSVTSGRQDTHQFDVRIDHRLTDKDSIFGSLSWSNEDKFNTTPLPGALDAAGFGGQSEQNLGRNAMVSYTRVWSGSFITESRLAYSRLVTERVQANSDQDLFREFNIGGYNPTGPLNGGLPNIQPEGYSNVGGSEWLPTLEYSNVWDFIQNVSINTGRHAVKFGYEYRPIGFPFYQVPTPRGTFRFQRNRTNLQEAPGTTGDGIASWLLGYPGDSTITTQNFISSEKVAHAWYIQDDWKVAQRLTLNIGLRYELFSPISEKFGRQSTYDRDRQTLVIPEGKDQDAPLPPNFAESFPQITVERGIASKYLIPWDKTNFGPRIGIAYNPWDRTVFRLGFGMFYGGEENQGGNPNRGEGVPFNQTQNLNLTNPSLMNPFLTRFTDGWPVDVFNLPANISFRTIAPNFRTPLVQKWNATIQQDLGWNTAIELGYVGSHGAR
ncbi:MAG: carboxypeptidase regulatory-like domain-containing protein, partial [Bryobacteraceae bacterium]